MSPASTNRFACYADQRLMILRSMAELYESIREFVVAVDSENRVVGCVALHVFWEDLAEIRCLAVAEHVQGLGIGRRLMDACWEAARQLEIKSVFALTSAVGFFERCGYHRIDKSGLPQRIWNECVRCPSFPSCRKSALIRSSEPEPAHASASQPGSYRGSSDRAIAERPRLPRRKRFQPIGLRCGHVQAAGQTLLIGLAVSIATAFLMLATEPRLAIGWDEGYTLGREARLRLGSRGLPIRPVRGRMEALPPDQELVQQADKSHPPGPEQIDTRAKLLFDTAVLAWFWPFAREEPHGHPPFYAMLGLTGDLLAPSWQDLTAGPAGTDLALQPHGRRDLCLRASRWGRWPAALAAGSWVLQPNFFGHGHYAAYDAVLSSLWVLRSSYSRRRLAQ